MKKASEVCGKPWCEKDARDVLEEDSTVSYGDGGGEEDENRDSGDLLDGNVLLRDLKDDRSRADKKVAYFWELLGWGELHCRLKIY